MSLSAWSGRHLLYFWACGLTLTALLVIAGGFYGRRELRRTEQMLWEMAQERGAPTRPPSGDYLVTYSLPVDSPEAVRLERAERRLDSVMTILTALVLAIPAGLLATTVAWLWLRRAGSGG